MFRSSRLWNLLMKCSYTMTNTNCWLAQWIRQSHHIVILHTHSLFLQWPTQLLVNTDFHWPTSYDSKPSFVILSWIWHTAPIQIEIHNIVLNVQTNYKDSSRGGSHSPMSEFSSFPQPSVVATIKLIARLCNKFYDHLVKWKCSSSLSSSSSTWTLYANLKQLLLKSSSL